MPLSFRMRLVPAANPNRDPTFLPISVDPALPYAAWLCRYGKWNSQGTLPQFNMQEQSS